MYVYTRLVDLNIYELLRLCPQFKRIAPHVQGVLNWNLKKFKSKKIFYMGRGTGNGDCHAGHFFVWKIGVQFAKYAYAKTIFMIADDQKNSGYCSKIEQQSICRLLQFTGFSPRSIFIFKNSANRNYLYANAIKYFASDTQIKTIFQIFGKTKQNSVFSLIYPMVQSFVVLLMDRLHHTTVVVTGKDQLPYFKYCTQFLKNKNITPPIVFVIKNIPCTDMRDKMSATYSKNAIFFSDKSEHILDKFIKARSGAPNTMRELKEKGIIRAHDFAYIFSELMGYSREIRDKYACGKIGTVAFKKNVCAQFLRARAQYNKIKIHVHAALLTKDSIEKFIGAMCERTT